MHAIHRVRVPRQTVTRLSFNTLCASRDQDKNTDKKGLHAGKGQYHNTKKKRKEITRTVLAVILWLGLDRPKDTSLPPRRSLTTNVSRSAGHNSKPYHTFLGLSDASHFTIGGGDKTTNIDQQEVLFEIP